ncbi:hypothetical protein AB0C10_23450 [Microbispora amethystogenes]|uniref:Lactococcin 972 family bacteriocin n=1 Tax=Microbispora cellulosiformans TaxID=2614688 RepID=A0A5J5JX03_9ACTN|nr:hypothetical protein [Microbispora cellulosiformans]KAA9374470.1 hypothetical protein F5972_31725 [Microbispora cellulosiformans]
MSKLKKVIAGFAFSTALAGGALALSATAAGAATAPTEYGYSSPAEEVLFNNTFANSFDNWRTTALNPCGTTGYGDGYSTVGINNTADNSFNNWGTTSSYGYGETCGSVVPSWNDSWWDTCLWANAVWGYDCYDDYGCYN